LKNKKNVKT